MPRLFGWAPGVRAFSSKRRRCKDPAGAGWSPALRPKAFGQRAVGGHKGRPCFWSMLREEEGRVGNYFHTNSRQAGVDKSQVFRGCP